MSAMHRLAELPAGRLRWLGPAGLSPAEAHARLRPLLAALGPHHAALLAEPVATPSGLAWDAPGQAHRAMPALDAGQRQVFDATLATLLSDIRRAAEAARAAGDVARADLLDLVRRVPAPELVFAVDGAPVLAGWGHAAANGPLISVLAPFDDGVRAAARPGDRLAIGLAALALLLLALAAWLAAPVLRDLLRPPAPACVVDAEGLADLQALDRARAEARDLAAERDRLRTERGRRQLDCALPEAPPAPEAPRPPPRVEPRPPPAPPSPPAPRTDLPAERWNRGDLGMLEGCWNLDSNYTTRDVRTGRVSRVQSWRMCFDRNGRGSQTLIYDNGTRCEAPVEGSFDGPNLRIRDRGDVRCTDGSYIFERFAECRRVNDSRAACTSRQPNSPSGGTSNYTLQR